MAYCTDADIDKVYGTSNIERWADLDNVADEAAIKARKEWARERATTVINGLLRGGRYAVPFADPYPVDIVDLTALQAGIVLFDGRRVTDTVDPEDQVSAQRDEVDLIIRKIRANQYVLEAPIAVDVPAIVNGAEASSPLSNWRTECS